MGHLINHPPEGSQPNVISVPYDLIEGEFPDHLCRYIPNVYFLPQSKPSARTSRVIMSGMVIIATKDLGTQALPNY